MINQKQTKILTENYTTSDADLGYRLICNSASDFAITLHSPTGRNNFDLEIDNINTGVVSCNSMQIKPNTHAHLGNTGTAWILVVSDLEMTKAEIESVLTGEVDSHSHPAVYELPTGGTAGQVLAKVDGTDRNVEWVDQTGGGGSVYYEPLVNGDASSPEIMFDDDGDVIMVEV